MECGDLSPLWMKRHPYSIVLSQTMKAVTSPRSPETAPISRSRRSAHASLQMFLCYLCFLLFKSKHQECSAILTYEKSGRARNLSNLASSIESVGRVVSGTTVFASAIFLSQFFLAYPVARYRSTSLQNFLQGLEAFVFALRSGRVARETKPGGLARLVFSGLNDRAVRVRRIALRRQVTSDQPPRN